MKNHNQNFDEEQALAQLLGIGSGSPVATPEMLMRMAQWLHATLKKEIAERPVAGQVWGRIADVQRIYNVSDSAAKSWMAKLRAEGKVRMQRPISGAKGAGDLFYNLSDIAAAFEENAERRKG